jgi:hypothetical protein
MNIENAKDVLALSMAFIVPFGRYCASKNSFRTFLFAMVFWSLVFGLLFWMHTEFGDHK